MKALVHVGKQGIDSLKIQEVAPKSSLEMNQVRVQLKTGGLNHRDLSSLEKHQNDEEPVIVGGDGAGIIAEVGADVASVSVGDEVIINPGIGWNESAVVAPEEFAILGYPLDGTFAEEIVLSEKNVFPKPKELTWEEAGVLGMAGLTAYRVLFTKADIRKGDKVFIPGIGGGVATYLLQFAVAAGAEVYVTSRSEKKLAKAKELGAAQTILNDADWKEVLGDTVIDIAIDSVGSATFNRSLEVVKRGGTIVTFGSSTNDVVELNLRQFFYGQYTLKGSTMGSGTEFSEMLKFVAEHKIKPVIDTVLPISNYKKAYQLLTDAQQMGKISLVLENFDQ